MSNLDRGFNGKCLCGEVKYICIAAPQSFLLCHCRDCQTVSGGAPASVVMVPEDAVQIFGELKEFTSVGESGKDVVRKFCGVCGTQVFTSAGMLPGVLCIKAGTMDDASELELSAEIWVGSSQPWQALHNNIPHIKTQGET